MTRVERVRSYTTSPPPAQQRVKAEGRVQQLSLSAASAVSAVSAAMHSNVGPLIGVIAGLRSL